MIDRVGMLRGLSLGAALVVAGCSGEPGIDFDAQGYGGLTSKTFALLATACTVDGVTGAMVLTVADDESAYVFKRATDGKVVANANLAGGAECATTTTAKITIGGSTGDNKVVLDFINGNFGLGTAMVAGNILIDLLGDGVNGDQVTMRGSASTTTGDTWTFGVTGANINNDGFVDVKFTGVEDVKISTGPGNDTITGQGSAATGAAFATPMTVFAGEGADIMTSGAAGVTNALNGEAGNDTFVQQLAAVADIMAGGADTDTLTYAIRTTTVSVILDAVATDGAAGELDNAAADIENLTGGAGNDVLDASAATTAAHVLLGNAGDDVLAGSDLVDTLTGGAGSDTLKGGLGSDTLTGGTEIDTVDYSDHAAAVVVKMDGSTVAMGADNGSVGERDVFNVTVAAADIENLRGGPLGDTLTGNASANIIWGGAGNDTITGLAGSDTIYGEADDDNIDGGAGDDVIVGGLGLDTMAGGAGNDAIDAVELVAETDPIIDCGTENDIVFLGTGDTQMNCELLN